MIRFLKVSTFAISLGIFAAMAAPASAVEETSGAKGSPPPVQSASQDSAKTQKVAQQKKQLVELEENVLKPFLKKQILPEVAKKFYQKMLELKGRVDKGEDVGEELAFLKTNAERAYEGKSYQVDKDSMLRFGYKTKF